MNFSNLFNDNSSISKQNLFNFFHVFITDGGVRAFSIHLQCFLDLSECVSTIPRDCDIVASPKIFLNILNAWLHLILFLTQIPRSHRSCLIVNGSVTGNATNTQKKNWLNKPDTAREISKFSLIFNDTSYNTVRLVKLENENTRWRLLHETPISLVCSK